MHPVYSQAQLENKSLVDLEAIASKLGVVATDKRIKQSWIEAILKVQPVKVDPQPSKLLVDVDGDTCLVDGQAIATITSDDDLTQPWVVKINGIEVHRRATWALAYDYVRSHVKYGTLPNPQPEPEQIDDYLFHDDPAPKLPQVGDKHFVGDFLLECVQIGCEYAAVWEVWKDSFLLGDISMNWDACWVHPFRIMPFATPQEAVIDLYQSAVELAVT